MPYLNVYAYPEPLRSDVDALAGVTLLEFGAPWCPHCIGAQPLLAEVLAAHDDVRHLKVEDGPGRALGRSFRIKLWPSLLLLRDGTECGRVVRPESQQQIERMFALLQ